jgi:hypothetical protein
MTKAEWSTEVEAALVGAGSEWRVFKVWVELTSPMVCAELTTGTVGETKHITLARDRFSSADERRAELLRQLYGDSPKASIKAGRRKDGRV